MVRADDGSPLLTYDAGNVEDDEGPAASAWRIVGPDGRTVAEHAEHTDAEATPVTFEGAREDFAAVPQGETAERAYALDVRGTRHQVTLSETPLDTRAGDILLAELEPTLVYRPATRVYRPATRTAASPAWLPDDADGLIRSIQLYQTSRPSVLIDR